MTPTVILILRLVHVVGGILWVGGLVSVAFFILPSVFAAGPAGGLVMKELVQIRRMPNIMMGFAWATVLAGFALFYNDARGAGNNWTSSRTGSVIGAGAVLAIVAIVIGMIFSAPTAKKLGAHAAAMLARGGPPTAEDRAEMARLQRRMLVSARIVVVLVILAAATMAMGRYL